MSAYHEKDSKSIAPDYQIRGLAAEWAMDGTVQAPPVATGGTACGLPLVATGGRGACLSITHPQNSQAVNQADTPAESPRKVWGSEDTLVLNFYCEIGQTQGEYEALMASLERARLEALESGKPGFFVWKGETYLIAGKGCSIGGAQGVFVHYILEREGVRIYIAAARFPKGYNFNVRASVGSEALMAADGAAKVYASIRKWLKKLGIRVDREMISRVDMAVEVPLPVDEFIRRYLSGGLISRYKRFALHQGAACRSQGLTCGKGAVMLRIYDKAQELRDTGADTKAAIMASRRAGWGEECTRVEYQLRAEFLKKYDIRTFADWVKMRGALMDYLAIFHTRLADECGDRTHSARIMPCDVWLKVIQAFQAVCGGRRSEEPIEKVNRSGAKAWNLMKQGMGCLLAAVALQQTSQGVEHLTAHQALQVMESLMISALEGQDVGEVVNDRMRRYALALPTRAAWYSGDGSDFEEPPFSC